MKARVDIESCIGCGVCVLQCPERAIALMSLPEPVAVVDRVRCDGCGLCVEICPTDAIELPGKATDREYSIWSE